MAFLLVFISHLSPFSSANFISTIGWTGVELFFLLSGFLLTHLLVAEYNQTGTVNLYKYFIRRILRIWPLYFLYLLGIIIASQYVSGYPLSQERMWGNIFFYDNIMAALHGFNKNLATGHLWSISLEEQYYLILPFLVPWLIKQSIKKKRRFFIILFIILFMSRYLLTLQPLRYSFIYVLPFSCDYLLAGIILGLGDFTSWTKKINTTIALALGIALLLCLHFFPQRTEIGSHTVLTYFLPAAAFFFLFISVVYSNRSLLFRIFTNKPIRYLGKISFGLYVFHVIANRIAYSIYYTLNRPMDVWGFFLSLSITILLAILSYELIEKHFLKMKSRFTVIKNRDV
jgi:peptidoglycan/LPS O-acetylase OafA/YrhL